MTWIETIEYREAQGALLELYDGIKGPDGNIDNIILAHSLRPHTLEGHMALYKRVLHHRGNQIDRRFLEVIGIHVSILNRCEYCIEHHSAGLGRLLADGGRVKAIVQALERGRFAGEFDDRESRALAYARLLTESPSQVSEKEIEKLRAVGWEDGEILEINQVTAYFNYANRTVLGLGVEVTGDILGLSPGDLTDTDNWQHR
ncbi:MAG TPA: alkylhydroperoxidase [Planctomycetes bacterium]|nr:alkylhydroperoxidase [Planctomycetota bacterium]